MKYHKPLIALTMAAAMATFVSSARSAGPPARSVAEIQDRHDRAFINELAAYLKANPKAADRDHAYAALFNTAIEHDWFAEVEPIGQQYVKAEPDGPVKALAQIVLVMGRARAGRYQDALARYREFVQGLPPDESGEELALTFTDEFARSAVAAGEFAVGRQVYSALLERFKQSPDLRQKFEPELKRLDQVGKPVPAFSTVDLDGQKLSLDSYRGKYVLLDFWATWCAPCVAELPRLQAAYQSHHAAGLEIVGVSLDDSKTAVVDFVKARKVPWRQIHNGTSPTNLLDVFGVNSIPATYLIDPNGTVVRIDLRGKPLDETLTRLFQRTAARPAAARPR